MTDLRHDEKHTQSPAPPRDSARFDLYVGRADLRTELDGAQVRVGAFPFKRKSLDLNQ